MNARARALTAGESPIRGSADFRQALLSWYDAAGRDLPWRLKGQGKRARKPDPYRVWLSEVMLQQTTVAAVIPYFERFTARWPSVAALAAADESDVMQAWAGLGYYSRARNLIAAAKVVAEAGWPNNELALRALPGVGAYTAAAIAAIAFGQPANVVDGNVERVMARLFALDDPLPGAKAVLKGKAQSLIGPDRPGDYAQALMDLGATVCTPKSPKCLICPVSAFCQARTAGIAETLPRKAAKPVRPTRYGVAFVLIEGGEALAVRRPPEGLLGGMWALPTTVWSEQRQSDAHSRAQAPAKAQWRAVGSIRHVFTHFALELEVWVGEGRLGAAPETERRPLAAMGQGMPTVFRKAVERALASV